MVIESIVLAENEKLTAIVHLADSSILHIKERFRNGDLIKYSYHNIRNDKFVRWDNVPHHRDLNTFPDHKHENTDNALRSRKLMLLPFRLPLWLRYPCVLDQANLSVNFFNMYYNF